MIQPIRPWRRIQVPTRNEALGRGTPTFQDLAGRYLCSVGLSLVNSRHLAGEKPLELGNAQHIEALASALTRVAEHVFEAEWDSAEPGDGRRAARYRLERAKLLDGAQNKAIWVIAHWDPAKIEGRRRGGRHSAADGVRKGKTPRWTPGLLAEFAHLPPRERKAEAIAALGCSESQYYVLWRNYRESQAAQLARRQERAKKNLELMHLLPD